MADYYDAFGNYIGTVIYPGTVGYPDSEDEDESDQQPIYTNDPEEYDE